MDNPPAFPRSPAGTFLTGAQDGMSLHDYFAAQAMANPMLCDGQASSWELDAWFGKTRTGIKRSEIVAKQAGEYADAMIAARKSGQPS